MYPTEFFEPISHVRYGRAPSGECISIQNEHPDIKCRGWTTIMLAAAASSHFRVICCKQIFSPPVLHPRACEAARIQLGPQVVLRVTEIPAADKRLQIRVIGGRQFRPEPFRVVAERIGQ